MIDDLVNNITNKQKNSDSKSYLPPETAILFEDTKYFQSLEAINSPHYCNLFSQLNSISNLIRFYSVLLDRPRRSQCH